METSEKNRIEKLKQRKWRNYCKKQNQKEELRKNTERVEEGKFIVKIKKYSKKKDIQFKRIGKLFGKRF